MIPSGIISGCILNHPYRVLGVTQAGVPAEYLMITDKFIVDSSITPGKLVSNFVLFGTPSMTVHPSSESDNHQIASTHWVREVGSIVPSFVTTSAIRSRTH